MLTRKILPVLIFSVVLGGVAWRYTEKSSAASTLTPQDYADIQQLYSRYYHTIDAGASEAWADTFTSDGVFNGNTRGRDALIASNRRGGATRPLRHWHSNLTIEPSPEGAKGSVYVLQIDITTKPPSISTYSRYDDQLVKTPQGWRFKVRQRSTDTTIGPPTGR
jgi:SnoaL-like domain